MASVSQPSPEKKAVHNTKRDRTITLDRLNLLKQFNSDTYWGMGNFGNPNQSLNPLRIDVCHRQRILILGTGLRRADDFLSRSELRAMGLNFRINDSGGEIRN
jgi:hypothetical protein